jgi:hypothetical protein
MMHVIGPVISDSDRPANSLINRENIEPAPYYRLQQLKTLTACRDSHKLHKTIAILNYFILTLPSPWLV